MTPLGTTDLLGYVAAATVLATFSLREMRALRLMAIVSNLLFAAYAYSAGLGPVLLLHMLLLPLNAVRFYQSVQLDPGRRLSVPSMRAGLGALSNRGRRTEHEAQQPGLPGRADLGEEALQARAQRRPADAGYLGRPENREANSMTPAIRLSRGHVLVFGAVLLSTALGGALGFELAPRATLHAPLAVKRTPIASASVASAVLEEMRQDAALGNAAASRELTLWLLERYDLRGDTNDLFEAFVWIDRNLYADQTVGLAGRVAAYCDHAVVRWHPLCLPGE